MFPSATGTKQDDLSIAWSRARGTATAVKGRTVQLNSQSAAGSIPAASVLAFNAFLADARTSLLKSSTTPGIAAYAQNQINNPTLDVVTEFNTMMAAIDSTIGWIIANFPKDVNGFLLYTTWSLDNSGKTADRLLSVAETAGLRSRLDLLAATID